MAGVAIVGGETAIMENVEGFDLVSMGVGIVSKDRILDGSGLRAGDRIVGVASSGLHSNGYTLARRVLLTGRSIFEDVPELGTSLGDALLEPTLIYVKPALESLKRYEVHAIGHITGGAFTKLKRLAGGRGLEFALERPRSPPIFRMIQREGKISDGEMFRTFNMGVGLCVCAPQSEERGIIRTFRKHGFEAFDLGVVKKGTGVTVDGIRLA